MSQAPQAGNTTSFARQFLKHHYLHIDLVRSRKEARTIGGHRNVSDGLTCQNESRTRGR